MTKDDIKVWARHIHVQKTEPSMENLLKWMEDEMTARLRSGATIRKNKSSVNAVVTPGAREKSAFKIHCYVCQEPHYVDQCPKFLRMSVEERWRVVKEQKACFCCLKRSKGHTAINCLRKKDCNEKKHDSTTCSKPHHKLLHMENASQRNPPLVSFLQDNSQVLLPMLTGVVKGSNSVKKTASIFYDSGAQVSMIRNDFAESLGLESRAAKIVITKIGGAEEEMSTRIYKVPVCRNDGHIVQIIQAIGIPKISEDVPPVDMHQVSKILGIPKHNLNRRSGPIDLLIGINYSHFHTGETKIKNNFVARNSPLGWVVFGSNAEGVMSDVKQVLHIRLAESVDLTAFWKTEAMGVSVNPCTCEAAQMSLSEREELKEIEESCELKEKKWIMKYPWKKNPQLLPNNYSQVLKKLENTERRFSNRPEHANSYDKQIKEMEELGFAGKLKSEETERWKGPIHYIAHHAVLRPEKKTTPIRIVFNSSATFNGHSLNDYWHKGPDLLNNLFGVVLRFRENPVAVCGDITKMYHMISITPVDQHVHRFLWRSFETDRPPDVYVKTVLTFGDRPAPTMAITAMRKTAKMNAQNKPKAAEAIMKNAYVDDICDSAHTSDEAKSLTKDIDDILESGGFHVKKWISNEEIRDEGDPEEVMLGSEEQAEKVLGTVWLPKEDKFSYKIKVYFTRDSPPTGQSYPVVPAKLTKRQILSKLAGIFDPIGATAAVLIKHKIAMQQLWQLGLGWDDEIPTDERRKWVKLFQEMVALNEIKFERCLTPKGYVGNPTLVVFCDASRLAFGTCAYARWKLDDGRFEARFIAAKSRVAPLKELTIPRLELQAAVLGSRLGKTILSESHFNFQKVIYFSDSRVTLAWIQGQPRSYKPFVSSRVSEIQSNSQPSDWFHCPTDVNVADDLSKGISIEDTNGRWLNGPNFLKLPENLWPMERGTPNTNEVNAERRKIRITCAVAILDPVLKSQDFSKWRRLLRVTAYCMRFCHNLRLRLRRRNDEEKVVGPLAANELKCAEVYWLKAAQCGLKERMEKGELKTLTPFVDDEGIIRVGGRADLSLLSYDNKHPALLPHKHWISVLITREAHENGHSGVAATTAKTRRKYWIIKGHNIAKKVKRHCTFCREIQAKTETQFMANLPQCRLQPYTPPFMFTSCDYFGPINVKISRNKTMKHYGVIFTCLNTRAVHCELATDATTMEFLQVLRRFFSYRGYPKLLISDNGLQMVGAERELRAMINGWDNIQLREYCADRGMKWQFTTPLAPHQNGCSESLVKSCKSALKRAIGNSILTPFELYTSLLEVANLLNQRPIGRIPGDPDDGSYLCPNDMLMGRASNAIPQGPFRQTKNPRHRFEFCQRIVDSFWSKWSRDVLPQLMPRKKWNTAIRNVKVDDYVIVADPNTVRGKWHTGRITKVFPGEDGLVRNVEVKTALGTYTRPITKICVIYPVEGFED